MLKKKYRLSKTKEINTVFVRGRNFFNPNFNIKFVSKKLGDPRFAIIVSTKVSKKATKRNRLKRILRELIRLRLKQFCLGDYAVILKPQSGILQEKTVVQLFLQELIKLKLLKNDNISTSQTNHT